MMSSSPANPGLDPSQWAPAGEPVVPWIPSTLNNAFLSTVSFKPCSIAIVQDVELDIDAVARGLIKQYPGLPTNMLKNYVLAIALTSQKYAVGTRFKALIDYDTAALQEVGANTTVPLWEKQPLN